MQRCLLENDRAFPKMSKIPPPFLIIFVVSWVIFHPGVGVSSRNAEEAASPEMLWFIGDAVIKNASFASSATFIFIEEIMSNIVNRLRNFARSAGRRLSPGVADDIRLARYVKEWVLPRDPGTKEYYVPSYSLGHAGFDLHVDDELARISRWTDARYRRLFRNLRDDPDINTGLKMASRLVDCVCTTATIPRRTPRSMRR